MRNFTGFALWFALTWLCSSAMAVTTVTVSDVTNTQAIIKVVTDQPGNCTYQLSEAQDLSIPVNDVNTTLFPGSNSDARATSLVLDAGEHSFVAGTRRGDQGVDQKWYSRALAANTIHFGAAACGSDAPVAFTFTTRNIAVGNTYMEPLPFDSHALGNYAIPSFDFTDLSKFYVDPQTGFKFKLLTGPGQMPEGSKIFSNTTGNGEIAGAASGTNWTNPTSGLTADGSSATYTASAQDILTLRLPGQCPFGVCSVNNWQISLGNPSGYYATNIDSYQLALTGNGSGSAIQVDAALSWNGVTQATEWHTFTLPASNATVTYPADLFGGLAAWQGVNYPNIPGMYWQTVQARALLDTNGTVVTYTHDVNSVPFTPFSLDPRILTAGSKITITGVEYTIASVDSGTQITLTSSAGAQHDAIAWIANFSIMVRKHTPTPGTIQIDGVVVTVPLSNSFTNGNSGFQQHCSPLTNTDAQGKVGRFCIFPSHQGEAGIFWVTNDLSSRFMGRAYLRPSSIGVGADEFNGVFYGGQSLFDIADPNSWWIGTTLVSNRRTTLVKATYNPAGVSGCGSTANYQTLPLNANYSTDGADNCNITYSELTRPSQGKDLWTQINAMPQGAILNSGKFVTPALSFIQGGYAIMYANTGGQDTETWIITVRLSDSVVKGVYSTYMNPGNGSCRACVLHGVGPSNPTDDWFYLIFNNYPQGSSYQLSVNTALTNVPSIDKATCAAQVTDPAVAWLVPYSDGCDSITFSASDNIPCTSVPTAWDTGHAPLCSWHGGGWTQWQAGAAQIGDAFVDANVGFEEMILGKNMGGNTWILIRNINPTQGPGMIQKPGVTPGYLRAHASNWNAWLNCTYPHDAFVRASTEVDGSTLIWDRKFWDFNHSVLRTAGIISSEYYPDIAGFGQSVRLGTLPDAANTAETSRILNTSPFSGKAGLNGSGYIQSHIGWDGVSSWFTDMSPIAPPSGGSFYLWPQTGVVNVSGTLYKVPAANAFIPHAKKQRATAVWSGMYNFQDVSGTGTITGNPTDHFKYCLIDYAGATCGQAGEAVGDLYMNIPQATIDGRAGGLYDLNRVNAVPLGQEPMAVLQYYFQNLGKQSLENQGRWERRISTGFGRYNGQDTYANAKLIWNSNILLFNCSTPNLQRVGDLCVGYMPPDPFDSVVRYDFMPVKVDIPAEGPTYAEVQFGYAENGAPGQFYCTTRQEACNTSSPAGTPFNWEGETRTLTDCSAGCSIKVPALPEHVVYYMVRRSADGVTWTNGPMQAATN